MAVNAPESGTIKEFLVNEEDTVTVGQDLVRIELGEGGESKPAPKPEQPAEPKPEPKEEPKKEPAEQKIEAAAPKPEEKPQPQPEPQPAPPKEPKQSKEQPPQTSAALFGGSREERRVCILASRSKRNSETDNIQVKMNRMRLRIAERLKQSQNTAASLTTFNEVDMSSIMEFRKLYKDEVLKKTGIKLGFMSAFSRACVLAMKDVPAVNASIEGPNGGDTIVYRDYVDISVAVATEKGLVTPVVRNAESMDLLTIEKTIADLGKKVRRGSQWFFLNGADVSRPATTS